MSQNEFVCVNYYPDQGASFAGSQKTTYFLFLCPQSHYYHEFKQNEIILLGFELDVNSPMQYTVFVSGFFCPRNMLLLWVVPCLNITVIIIGIVSSVGLLWASQCLSLLRSFGICIYTVLLDMHLRVELFDSVTQIWRQD